MREAFLEMPVLGQLQYIVASIRLDLFGNATHPVL